MWKIVPSLLFTACRCVWIWTFMTHNVHQLHMCEHACMWRQYDVNTTARVSALRHVAAQVYMTDLNMYDDKKLQCHVKHMLSTCMQNTARIISFSSVSSAQAWDEYSAKLAKEFVLEKKNSERWFQQLIPPDSEPLWFMSYVRGRLVHF